MKIILYFEAGSSVISPTLECDNPAHKGFERSKSIRNSARKLINSMKKYGLIKDALFLHSLEEVTNA